MTPDLSVTLGRLKMKNPVTVASGTFGYGREYAELIDVAKLGAVTVKGLRTDPCDGNPTPRIAEVRAGLLNAIGLQGPGIPGFIDEYLPYLREKGVPDGKAAILKCLGLPPDRAPDLDSLNRALGGRLVVRAGR